MKDKNNSNKKFWNRFAKLYTPIQEKQNAKMYAKIVEDISDYFDKDKEVLELAMGTGQFTFSLCDKVKRYIATDFSEKMLEEAKRLHSEGIEYELQDATKLTYEGSNFDIVLIANALHIMPEPDKALREIRRVLKDDGVAILPTFIYEGKVNKFKLWVMARAGFKVFFKWNLKEYIDFVRSAGFSVVEHKLYPSKIGPECVLIVKKDNIDNI